jgi:hypothetical protein
MGRRKTWILRNECERPAEVGHVLRAKIGEGFGPLGFASVVLIKRIFENGDLESSQERSGWPEGTARV